MKTQIAFLATVLVLAVSANAKVARPPQFVMLAFDGSKDIDFWKKSREYAAGTATHDAEGETPLRFTYFASGVYFINDATKTNYVEPAMGAGKSAIGFGGTVDNLRPRVKQMQAAMEEGHEMASHANSHYDGTKYTEDQWDKEHDQFTVFMKNAWKGPAQGWKNKEGKSIGADNAAEEPAWWVSYFENEVVGFRAPLLGVGNGLWPSLKKHKFLYDTSRVDKMNYWPKQLNGIWNFPLAGVKIVGSGKNTLSMDYNFYFTQSKGEAGDPKQFKKWEDEMYNTYVEYFKSNYNGNRAPVNIGHHFSQWNGGIYWSAMKRFANLVCNKPEVRCVTYKELAAFMNTADAATITAYQNGDFDKSTEKVQGLSGASLAEELNEQEMEEMRVESFLHFKADEHE